MDNPVFQYSANGKLLLTGEYFVLDGLPALAVPTAFGQSFKVHERTAEGDQLSWIAIDSDGKTWLKEELEPVEWLELPDTSQESGRNWLRRLLYSAEKLLPGTTQRAKGKQVTSQLEFDRNWGLGSSSTLVAFVAAWLEVDPYQLLPLTFGGSGYDLACAVANGPIIYTRGKGGYPINWSPDWVSQTNFVYLNRKQNSREGIRAYRQQHSSIQDKEALHTILHGLLEPTLHLRAAAKLLRQHEEIIGKNLGLEPVGEKLFPDFEGQVKSLGAWGGDFVWVLSENPFEKVEDYFNSKGYEVVVPFNEMVL